MYFRYASKVIDPSDRRSLSMGLEKLVIRNHLPGISILTYNGGKVPILTSWTEMSLSQLGLGTLLSFFMIRPMINCMSDHKGD